MNPKTCLVPIERIHSPADASRQGELIMDSACSSLPGPNPTPDPPLPPDPSPFPGPPLPEPAPTPNPPAPPDPSPFPGPPVTIGRFTHLLSDDRPLTGNQETGSVPPFFHAPTCDQHLLPLR